VLLPLAPVLLGPTSRVRVASTVSPSFFLSAPLIAPLIVWCCHPVAAAICSTVAPSGRSLRATASPIVHQPTEAQEFRHPGERLLTSP
jgi:hypothetical protein